MLDCLGNQTTVDAAETLAGVDDFIAGFLGYERRAVNVLAAADSDTECVLANTYAGMIWMFLESPRAPAAAERYLERATANLSGANRRETMLVSVLAAWHDNDVPRATKLLAELVGETPTDLAAMKLGQYFCFNRGDAPGMLRFARLAEAANDQNPHFHGMAAFAYEQCHLLDKAERAANRAIEIKRAEPWAHHALAHVMLTRGRVREGAGFLDGVAGTWRDLNSFMYTHNWWHKALFSISLGDYDAVFKAYDEHCWGVDKAYSQDQIGAVSLLARMECAGLDVGERWQDVADHMAARACDTVQPFLTVQYLYGLARAGRDEADELMRAVEEKAKTADEFERPVWAEVALPACRGVLAHARGDHRTAINALGAALPRMAEAGGSHAQRDLFEQLLLAAHLKAGNWVTAQQMLEMRRIYDPDGVPLNRMLADVYGRLGLDVEAEEARARRYA
ncbi:MAG: tetratricopeptide repeat protein [Rhizobiaceae bacterium]